MHVLKWSAVLAMGITLTACGGGGSKSSGTPPPAPTYSVSGTVTGLTGSVVLRINDATDLTVSTNGAVTIAAALANGTSWSVVVKTQPTNPTQQCAVSNGSGVIAAANVTNVGVTCAVVPLALTGSTPAANAVDVDKGAVLTLDFSAGLMSAPAAASVTLTSAAGNADVALDVTDRRLTVTPALPLKPLTEYTLTVTTDLQGVGGERLAAPAVLVFTTRDRAWGAPMTAQAGASLLTHRLAMNAGGNAMLLYTDDSAGGPHVRARSFSVTEGWGAAVQLDNVASAVAGDVGIDAQGNAVAVWTQAPSYIGTSYFDAATATWTAPARIQSGVSAEYDPRVAMNAAGSAVAMWQVNTFTNIYQPFASRFTAAGGWGPSGTSAPGATIDHNTQAELAIDAAGNATALVIPSGGSFTEIWAHHATPSGWDGATRLASSGVGITPPRLALDRDGNALVVWAENDTARYNIWARYYSVATGWGTPRKIEDNDSASATDPDVAFDGRGDAYVVWSQPDGARSSIWFNKLSAGSWGTAALAESDDSGNAGYPRIVLDSRGDGLVAFTMSLNSKIRVFANRYRASGGWGTAVAVETDPDATCFPPVLAIDDSGNALAAWTQTSNSVINLRVARFE